MKRILLAAIGCGMLAALGAGPAAAADPEHCRNAAMKYENALAAVQNSTREYGACVAASHGHDKCSEVFDRLKSARDHFEDAVSDFKDDCPRSR